MDKKTRRWVEAVADTLQAEVQVKGERIAVSSSRGVDFGSFSLSFPMRARLDGTHDGIAAVLVLFRGPLWAYLLVDTADAKRRWLVFFDAGQAEFREWRGGDTWAAKLKKIDGKVAASFSLTDQGWAEWKPPGVK